MISTKPSISKVADGIIGHFGLGFYSAFMVAKEVEIITRSQSPNSKPVRWVCDGSPNFTMEETKKKELRNYSIDFGVCIFCGNCVEYCPTNCLSMTEEYELAAFDRHNLNFDNVALGRLPTNVTTDPSVIALKELAYLPKGVMESIKL